MCYVSYHFEYKCVINDILSVFIHSDEEGVSKCRKVTYLDRLNFWKRPRITIIFTIFQYSYMIESTTYIYFVPVWLHPLVDSSQSVSHIYKQLLCWKGRSTCSVIFSIWIRVTFCYSKYTRKDSMCLGKQIIHIFTDEMNDLWSANCSSLPKLLIQ